MMGSDNYDPKSKPADQHRRAKNIERPAFLGQSVDVLIPFHGQYDRVGRLIKSIWQSTFSNLFRVTLIDDASPNKSFLQSIQSVNIKDLNCVQLPERVGFSGALHAGFQKTDNPWVVFLHSDCEVPDVNWLMGLGAAYEGLREYNVKLVSARTNNPPGGAVDLIRSERADKNATDAVLNPKTPAEILEKDLYLPLFCSLCHRELFDRIDGFLKPYPIGWYEDLELACRMNKHGFRQAVAGDSWVYHEGGATLNDVLRDDIDAQRQVEENYDRCLGDIRNLGIL
jgi:GT2 family glycosyltransferase